MNNIRHYSSLRFAMLTVFVAINGGMLNQFFNCEFAQHNKSAIDLFQWAGAILSMFFFTYERALDHNLSCYWDAVKELVKEGEAFIRNRSWLYKVSVPIATHSVFIGAFLFWIYAAPSYFPCTAAP